VNESISTIHAGSLENDAESRNEARDIDQRLGSEDKIDTGTSSKSPICENPLSL
jgi:hypothetical protein